MKAQERQRGRVARNLISHWTEARVSKAFIRETRMLVSFIARSVNSGVMSPLRVRRNLSAAAPLLNAAPLAMIMRTAG
jgi:hypothetical protein